MSENKILLSNLDKIHSRVFKNYLFDIENNYSTVDFDEYNMFINNEGKQSKRIVYNSNIQAIKVERWVYDKKEEIIDRFRNIYSAFANGKENIALVVKRTVEGAEFYFAVKNDASENGNRFSTSSTINLLRDSIKGNFPGTIINYNSMCGDDEKCNEDFFDIDSKKAISILTNIASEKSEKHISQGIEKLLNGISPKDKSEEYTIIFLAEPINHQELLSIKNGYEELASNIYGYGEYQSSKGDTSSIAKGENDTKSYSDGINSSLSKTHGFNIGVNGGKNSSNSEGNGWLHGIAKNAKKIITNSKGDNVGISAGYQHSRTKVEGKSYTYTSAQGTNFCVTDSETKNVTENHKSYPITNLIKRIEKQLERLEQCEAVGLWKEATYILGGDKGTTKNVANYLLGLMQGEESFVEAAVVNSWHSRKDNTDFDNIRKFVKHFTHPLFLNNGDINTIMANNSQIYFNNYGDKVNINLKPSDIECITPTTQISSMELAQMMTFPYKSVQGLSSIECAEFERNVIFKNMNNRNGRDKRQMHFGVVNYMHENENTKVNLDVDTLTKHTFITGSTGSGKSTAIYKILHELRNKEVPFLVIEPAKGEYRLEFGECSNVYSTNVKFGNLLQLNPFKFPEEGITVQEHIDRLVEIFNVCWPMYAAMPAVLKEAIERAYTSAGWNLSISQNSVNNKLFPCFEDVLKQLYIVINESEFSQEVKSNYIGSLVTRVKSLTNGIFGQIFSSNDMGDDKLFEDYAIIDLSRVGSMETKAMIMGILVMRMQEYHMTYSTPTNKLRHVTVLEEAHNLLKKTSTEQFSEGSNLIGKSVEMIANAIAEMRTYGEGFIIADQSPGMMDMSVIRNTNTKIMLSLPDFSDRELVGKATGLNDEQIVEVAKLGQGVAVVYQNEWMAPILCAIEKYIGKGEEKKVNLDKTNIEKMIMKEKVTKANIADIILNDKLESLESMEAEIMKFSMSVETKIRLLQHKGSMVRFSKQEKIDSIFELYYTDKVKTAFGEVELALNLCEEINNEMKNYLFSKWTNALDIPQGLLNDDLIGIINILLYKLKATETFKVENCERLFGELSNWRCS